MESVKECHKCYNDKELTEFYNSKSTQDGKMTYCKDCAKEYKRKAKEFSDAAGNTAHKAWDEARIRLCLSSPKTNRKYIKRYGEVEFYKIKNSTLE